jgi:hypothetical protein
LEARLSQTNCADLVHFLWAKTNTTPQPVRVIIFPSEPLALKRLAEITPNITRRIFLPAGLKKKPQNIQLYLLTVNYFLIFAVKS